MTTRLLLLWVALQTLLGLWFLWLLWGGPALASDPQAAAGEDARSPRPDPSEVLRASVPDDVHRREAAKGGAPAGAASDPAGVLLYGRITDAAGNPVDKALLSIRQQDEHKGASATGPGGTYSVAGLLPGEAGLLVRTAGYRNFDQTLQLAGPAQRHDVVLQRAVVLQVIARTPAGEPLEGALRAAGMDEHINPVAIATREPIAALPVFENVFRIGVGRFRHARWYGRVEIEGAPAEMLGTLAIDGDLPVYASLIVGSALLGSQLVQPGQERVEFSLAPQAVQDHLGSVRLQLVAATTGQPLAAVRVEGPRVQITDAEGVAMFTDVVAGLHRLSTEPGKYAFDQLVRLEPGQTLDLGRVALSEAQLVSGVILDANGQPARASLTFDDLSGHTFPQPLRDDRTAGTDVQGRWQLRLGPHRYALHADLNEGSQQAHVLVDLSASVPEEICIRLQSTMPVKLVKGFGAGRSYLLSIRTRDGVPVFGSPVRAGFEQSIRLPPGDYFAEVHEDLALVRSFGLTVGGAQTLIRIP